MKKLALSAGVPNLVYRWRRLMKEGGAVAVGSDQNVVGEAAVKKLETKVRELERLLGKKTMGEAA